MGGSRHHSVALACSLSPKAHVARQALIPERGYSTHFSGILRGIAFGNSIRKCPFLGHYTIGFFLASSLAPPKISVLSGPFAKQKGAGRYTIALSLSLPMLNQAKTQFLFRALGRQGIIPEGGYSTLFPGIFRGIAFGCSIRKCPTFLGHYTIGVVLASSLAPKSPVWSRPLAETSLSSSLAPKIPVLSGPFAETKGVGRYTVALSLSLPMLNQANTQFFFWALGRQGKIPEGGYSTPFPGIPRGIAPVFWIKLV